MADMPLSGYRVIDLTTRYMGPFCTKMFADYGAEVIKIEPPGGDPGRFQGPFFHDEPHIEKSALFLHLNANKQSVTLDLESQRGRQIIKDLVRDADIVVESFKPGYLPGLGLGYDDLKEVNPKIIMTSITNYGQTGPYRDYEGTDITLYATGAAMKASGQEGKDPLKLAGRIASFQTGNLATTATSMALWKREMTGEGDYIDISFFETWKGAIDRSTAFLMAYQYTGETAPRNWTAGATLASGVYACADGFFHVTGSGPLRFPRMMAMLGQEELLNESPWNDRAQWNLPESLELFESFFVPWMLEHTKAQLRELCQQYGVLGAPINATEDLLKDPHYQERNYWQEVDHPSTGPVTYPGFSFHMQATPNPPRRHAPLLGEHTSAVLQGLGYSQPDIALLRTQGVL